MPLRAENQPFRGYMDGRAEELRLRESSLVDAAATRREGALPGEGAAGVGAWAARFRYWGILKLS